MTLTLRERLQFLFGGQSSALEQRVAALKTELIVARNEKDRYAGLLATELEHAAEREQDTEEYIRDLEAFVTATNNAHVEGEPLPLHPITQALSDKKGLLVGIADNRTAAKYRKQLEEKYGLQLRCMTNDRIREAEHKLRGVDYIVQVLGQGVVHDLTHIVKGSFENVEVINVQHCGYQSIVIALWKYGLEKQTASRAAV